MIVEPVPLGPPSAPRRRLRLIALIVPLALLAGVVAAGTLGPQPAPSPVPSAVAVAVASPTATGAPAPSAQAPADLEPGSLPPAVPARIAGLDVLSVVDALAQREAGQLGGVTAIAGYLGVREQPACASTFCARTGILAAQPFSASTGFADIGTHLHPQLPAGVVLPPAANLADVDPEPDGPEAPAAIIVARFDDPRARACLPAGRHCGEELVVERVVWVDGQSYPSLLAVDPGVTGAPSATGLRTAGRAAERALGTGATPMLTALLRPGAITYIDPVMAPIVAGLDQDAVWYVRGLHLEPGANAIAWVIAERDGTFLLHGSVPVAGPSGRPLRS